MLNVRAQSPTDGSCDAPFFQQGNKTLLPVQPALFIASACHIVHGNQVNMAKIPRNLEANSLAHQSMSLTPLIMAYSKEIRLPVLSL